jgi:putative aminopeptidase FrvX
MDTWQVLETLAGAAGPPGHEEAVAAAIEGLWTPYCLQVRRDVLGNVIGVRPAERSAGDEPAPLVMLATHMDEIAFIVTRIESGFLRVAPLGGVDLRCLLGQEVLVHGRMPLPGVVGYFHTRGADKAPKWDEVFVDVGLPQKSTEELISPGDIVTFMRAPRRLSGNRAAGKAFDNRAGVAVVCEALARLATCSMAVGVCAVATVQEEVGLRGATIAAFGLAPQAGIAIDVGFGDGPGLAEHETIALGKGPAIAVGANIHPGMRKRLLEVARAEGVPHQVEVVPGSSGTDAWAMQISQAGLPTAIVSVPLRYMHSPVECLDLDDIRACGRLLASFLATLSPAEVWRWNHGPA